MALTCGKHKTSISNANAVGMTDVVATGFIPVNQCMHEHKCHRHGRYNYTAWDYKPGVKTMPEKIVRAEILIPFKEPLPLFHDRCSQQRDP